MKRAMERHETGDARVIPIILRHVDWQRCPFGKLTAAPKDGKPVTAWASQDEAFTNIAHMIRTAAVELKSKSKEKASRLVDGAQLEVMNLASLSPNIPRHLSNAVRLDISFTG